MSDAEFDEWWHARTPRSGPPRGDEEPMAFTGYEFGRGLLIAIVTFSLLVPLIWFTAAAISITVTTPRAAWGSVGAQLSLAALGTAYALGVSAVGALGASLIGGPIAWRVGRSLQRERRRWVHLVCHAFNGFVVGALAAGVIIASTVWGGTVGISLGDYLLRSLPGIGILAGIAALCVAFGWWCAARGRLRDDAAYRIPPPAPGWVP